MSDVDQYRAKAEEYSRMLKEATTPEMRERLSRMEESYRLLARNAEWLIATAAFVTEMRARPLRPPIGRRGWAVGAATPPATGQRPATKPDLPRGPGPIRGS
jgi:hypothetical protein